MQEMGHVETDCLVPTHSNSVKNLLYSRRLLMMMMPNHVNALKE